MAAFQPGDHDLKWMEWIDFAGRRYLASMSLFLYKIGKTSVALSLSVITAGHTALSV